MNHYIYVTIKKQKKSSTSFVSKTKEKKRIIPFGAHHVHLIIGYTTNHYIISRGV